MSLRSYIKFREEVNNGTAKLMQELEDDRLESAINREVAFLFGRWKESIELEKEYPGDRFAQRMLSVYPEIKIFNPVEFSQIIYSPAISRYANANIREIINQKFEEKKINYNNG